MTPTDIRQVAVVATGVIGASWTAHFLAHGLDVVATDPAPGAEERLRASVAQHWPVLEQLRLAPSASQDRLRFTTDVQDAVQAADFVQENGPERLDFKIDLFRRLDEAAPSGTILSSSSSGLLISQVQSACRLPGRVLLGHPFNPPHLIPLVEVVGGEHTTPEAIATAMAFYASIGKRPIHIRKEVKGHVANRLQAALWREAFHLVETGVASVADIDTAIAHGPGLRWALLGPFLNLHLSGGSGGIGYLLKHLGPPMDDWWQDLGATRLNPALEGQVVQGVADELASRSSGQIEAWRDTVLVNLLTALKDTPPPD
ncbi:MAG: 3-hydroxyacyl-CoA dehydrogenase NAD-binding domain-containing protein [Rhodopila sp.]|jgi:3-hydroxyacyl-CoA dehydrogenase